MLDTRTQSATEAAAFANNDEYLACKKHVCACAPKQCPNCGGNIWDERKFYGHHDFSCDKCHQKFVIPWQKFSAMPEPQRAATVSNVEKALAAHEGATNVAD